MTCDAIGGVWRYAVDLSAGLAERGIETVLIPSENEKDLKEIPAKIKRGLKIVLVEEMDEVLAHALAMDDPSTFLHKGDHDIDDIYEVPRAPLVPTPAGSMN